jgi:hypothetical protein
VASTETAALPGFDRLRKIRIAFVDLH